jgi:hypothetical protein
MDAVLRYGDISGIMGLEVNLSGKNNTNGLIET